MLQGSTAILAKGVGIYREEPLAGPLSDHFSHVWFHHLSDICGRMAVVPDGCSDLILVEGQLFVVGPDQTAAFPAIASGSTIVGLRFRPGSAMHWLKTPLSHLVGQTVPLEAFWGRQALEIEDRLAECGAADRLEILLRTLRQQAATVERPHAEMRALFCWLSQSDPRRASIRRFAASSAVSERTLRRRSLDSFGYGPKTLERVLRFQRLLTLMGRQKPVQLADFAAESGYADQAHMSREVRELSGLTPREICAQLSLIRAAA